VSFEGFKNHQPELWHGLERPDLDRIEVVIEIVRQRTAPDDKAAGEPQPLTVLAYRVDQFIHTVAQALVEFAGDFHRAGDLSQELDQRTGSPVFLFIVSHGFLLLTRSPFPHRWRQVSIDALDPEHGTGVVEQMPYQKWVLISRLNEIAGHASPHSKKR